MNLLQLVQATAAEIGIQVPASVAGNQTQDVIQLQALLNALGQELLRIHSWQKLQRPYRFTTQYVTTTGTWGNNTTTLTNVGNTTGVDTTWMAIGTGIYQDTFVVSVDPPTQVTIGEVTSEAQTNGALSFAKVKYDLPSDYDGMIPRTQWDKSKHWEMLGPESPQQWEWLLSGYISTGPRIRWRLYTGYFQIWPPNTTAEYLGFEYRSNGWAESAAGNFMQAMTADTDTAIYPDRLLINGLKLKYFEAKGFDTTAMARNYAYELEASMALDQSAANLSFAPGPSSVLLSFDNLPDSGYGGGSGT